MGSSSCTLSVRTSARHARADRQRAGVAHEDASGCGVPPEEAGARTHHGGGRHREVEGVVDLVLVEVPERPEADRHQAREHEDGRSGGQPVEAVGEVDAVRRGVDEQDGPGAPADVAELPARAVPAGERQAWSRRRSRARSATANPVATTSRPKVLARLDKPGVALVADLDPVVEETDEAGADDAGHDEEPGAGEEHVAAQVGAEVAHDRRGDDGHAAHGGRAGLDRVAFGDVLVDRLADLAGDQHVHQHLGAEDGDGHRPGTPR